MGYTSINESLSNLMSKRAEDHRRQDSIDAYKKELDSGVKPESSTSQPAFDPEPVMRLEPEDKKRSALRQMLYDMKGVNW